MAPSLRGIGVDAADLISLRLSGTVLLCAGRHRLSARASSPGSLARWWRPPHR